MVIFPDIETIMQLSYVMYNAFINFWDFINSPVSEIIADSVVIDDFPLSNALKTILNFVLDTIGLGDVSLLPFMLATGIGFLVAFSLIRWILSGFGS